MTTELKASRPRGLVERLKSGENIIIAEGYQFEFERRGYLKAGAFVPEIVLERPDLLKVLHEEFVHAGSDVVLAFTYYGHREKMRVVGREDELEKLNVQALRIARQVADETGTLMAGDLCNTNVYVPDDPATHVECAAMFKEQIEWIVKANADYIVLETMSNFGEAMIGLEAILKFGNGLPAVVTMSTPLADTTLDGVPYTEALQNLKDAGATLVGFNCGRGQETMLPLLRSVRESYKGPLAALPVCFRTSPESISYHTLKDPKDGTPLFPVNLSCAASSRDDIAHFAKEAKQLGVQYVGLCCGSCSHFLRTLSEGYGRHPPASRYSADMSQHAIFGDRKKLRVRNDPIGRKMNEMKETS